jgi:hypothetical protein
MSYSVWRGVNDATANIANTALGIARLQSQQRHQRALEADSVRRLAMEEDRFKITQEQESRQKKIFDYQIKKQQQQEQVDNAYVSVSNAAPNLMDKPDAIKYYEDALTSAGFKVNHTPDGDIQVQNKALKYIKELRQTRDDFAVGEVKSYITSIQNQGIQITKQISELKASGKADEKTLGPLLQKQTQVREQLANLVTLDEEVQKQLAIADAKKVPKTKSVLAYGPNGEQTYFDLGVGESLPSGFSAQAPQRPPLRDPDTISLKQESEARKKISSYITRNTEARNATAKLLETAMGKNGKNKSSPQALKLAKALEVHDGNLSKAKETLSQLDNGEIDPSEIKFGGYMHGGGGNTPTPKKDIPAVRADLIKNGYSEPEADAYIKRAKTMGKL